MQSEPATVLEKLYEAVLVLASGEGKIDSRLGKAYFGLLCAIPPADFPAPLQSEWQSISTELQRLYPVEGVIDGIDQTSAVNVAQRILLVYDALIR